MSFYNLVHGENPFADVLLAIVGLTRGDVPRYRDCYWTGSEIAIHTRTGGGNRDAYEGGNSELQDMALYLRDEDDDYDSTYATFYFSMPEKFAWIIPQLQAEDRTPEDRWKEAIGKLNNPESADDQQVKRVIAAMQPIVDFITKTETP
jgi:hypothetical protein